MNKDTRLRWRGSIGALITQARSTPHGSWAHYQALAALGQLVEANYDELVIYPLISGEQPETRRSTPTPSSKFPTEKSPSNTLERFEKSPSNTLERFERWATTQRNKRSRRK